VQFELAVAGVEMSVIGKSRSSVHQLMERSIPSTLPEVRTPEKKVEKNPEPGPVWRGVRTSPWADGPKTFDFPITDISKPATANSNCT
jgi:hypothetical protein